jgi:hypothetical protein
LTAKIQEKSNVIEEHGRYNFVATRQYQEIAGFNLLAVVTKVLIAESFISLMAT